MSGFRSCKQQEKPVERAHHGHKSWQLNPTLPKFPFAKRTAICLTPEKKVIQGATELAVFCHPPSYAADARSVRRQVKSLVLLCLGIADAKELCV